MHSFKKGWSRDFHWMTMAVSRNKSPYTRQMGKKTPGSGELCRVGICWYMKTFNPITKNSYSAHKAGRQTVDFNDVLKWKRRGVGRYVVREEGWGGGGYGVLPSKGLATNEVVSRIIDSTTRFLPFKVEVDGSEWLQNLLEVGLVAVVVAGSQVA